jgi:SAM-dependent methyltransferase
MNAQAVSFASVGAAEKDLWLELHRVIDGGVRRVCDVGGGARPVLGLDGVERYGLDYLVLDESPEELERAPAGYVRAAASILDADAIAALVRERGAFDAVISRWTAEHVRDGRLFHEHVFALLRPGGSAIHLFPTLYAPPFLVNRLLPAPLSSGLLFRACPNRSRKFRPYYSWCRGPSERQIRRLQSTGFAVERYTGYFGHGFYRRVWPLAAAQRAFNGLMLEHPLASMTSFALLVLRRPE